MKWCGLFHRHYPEDGWHFTAPSDSKRSDKIFPTHKKYCEHWDGENYIMVEVDDADL